MKQLDNFLLAAALLALCQLVPPSQARAREQQHAKPETAAKFIEQNIGLTAQPLTLVELRARIRANKESSRPIPNRNVPGQMDHMVVLNDGRGVEVEAYVPASGPVLIDRITVTTPNRELPAGLRIGHSSPDDLYDTLGTNAEQTEKGPGGAFAKRYYNLERTTSALLWFDHNERLAGVEWTFGGD
jgi:hypothetical protein